MLTNINLDSELGRGDGFVVYMDENRDLIIHVDMESRLGESKSGKNDKIADANWFKVSMPQGAAAISMGVWLKKRIRHIKSK